MIDKKNLSMYSIFDGFDDQELALILTCCEPVSYKYNNIIIEESSTTSDLFILTEGRVSIELDISLVDSKTREQLLILRAGDIFGEIGFLTRKRRSAYVIAIDDIKAIKINREKLYAVFSENMHIGFTFMKNIAITVSNRLEDANFRWKDSIRNYAPDIE